MSSLGHILDQVALIDASNGIARETVVIDFSAKSCYQNRLAEINYTIGNWPCRKMWKHEMFPVGEMIVLEVTLTKTGKASFRMPWCQYRFPVELGGVQSLMPLHSVTASVLLTSMLSCKGGNWGCLLEDRKRGYILDGW